MRILRVYFFAWFALAGYVSAAVIQVPGDVSTIQQAINMASPGDTVVVAEGVYGEYLQLMGKDITVAGSNPDDWGVVSRTIIQPPTGFTGPVVQFAGSESSACVFTGITVQNGKDVGIRGNNAQATISRCWVRNNTSTTTGGIHTVLGLIDRCRVTGNYGINVGGIGSCGGIISNCLVTDNRAGTYAGGLHNCTGTIVHCTILNNTGGPGTGGVNQCTGTITNCIVWGNTAVNGSTRAISDVSNSSQPTYSCYSKAVLVDGNIKDDPQLGPGYSLMAGSPCIDAGTNTPPAPLAAVDYRGGNRMVDGDDAASVVTDMGAIEFDPMGISLVVNPERLDFGGAGGVASFPVKTFELYNLDGYSGNWPFDTAGAAWLTVAPTSGTLSQTAQTITVTVDPTGLAEGEYTCNLGVVVDGTTKLVVPIVLQVGKVIRVPQDVAKIQPAIVQAVDWDTIIVSPGEYKENLDFLGKKIYLRSADPRDWNTVQTTIVNGRCIGPCVTFNKGEGRDSIVEGLTLQLGGGTNVSVGSINNIMGGGILCQNSSPMIRRCNISWNGYSFAPTSGQWPPDSNPKAYYGGGIALIGSCQALIEDCLLMGNVATLRGGAIYATTATGEESRSRSVIERCTVSDNYPSVMAILSWYDIDCTMTGTLIRNTIVRSISPSRSILVANTNQIQYCNVQTAYLYSGSYGTVVQDDIACKNGTISGDPLFVLPYGSTNPPVYDYRLKAGSPCINHGDPGFGGEGVLDLDGQKRVQDGRLDMGAFEFAPEIRVTHPMEGDVWAAGSVHDILWTEYRETVVVVNPGFDTPFPAMSTGGTVTTVDAEVPGWTVGPNSGVEYLPEKFDSMPTLRGKINAFDRGSGVYQLLVDSFRPNCRYTLKLFVGSRKDTAAVTNWQAAITAGDRSTVVAAVTQAELGIPGLGKWVAVSLVVETGAEGVDANVGKQIGILLTGLPRVAFEGVSLDVAELAPKATVDVEFSADNGQSWQTIADDLPDTGSTSWTIPSDVASEACRVRAVSSRADFVAVPSGLFAVRPYQAGAAVESRWPTEGHDMQRTGLAADNGPELGCVKWQYNAGSPIATSAAIGLEDRVIAGGSDGKLAVLDSAGQTLWTYTLAAPLTGRITIGADGSVYVGDQKGVLYAIDPSGQVRWKHQTKAMIAGAAAVTDDGRVIFGSVDGTIVALGDDGSELWSFAVPGPGKVGGAVVASPTIGRDGNVYVGGMYNGKLYALDPADGHIVWTCTFDAGAANQNRSIANAPAVATDGTIYATLLNDTRLYAVNPDGTIAWTTNLAGTAGGDYSTDYPTRYKEVYPWASAAVGPDGTIYVAFDDPYLRAVNPNGTIRWVRRIGMYGGFSVSVGANRKIYAAGDDLGLYVLDAEGAILSRFDGSNWLSWPVIGADETLYVSDFAGMLWAIAPQPCDGKPQRLGRPADITLDGNVRLEDLAELAVTWGQCIDPLPPCRKGSLYYIKGDVDRDYWVGLSDLLAMAERWLTE